MQSLAQRSLRSIAGVSCRLGSSSVASSSRIAPRQVLNRCTHRRNLSTAPTPTTSATLPGGDNFDPYPDKTDQELLNSLQQSSDLPEIEDVFSLTSTPLPIDCASAYICLRLRPSFPDIFPTVPMEILSGILSSCSQRGFSRVAHHIVDDIIRLRHDDLPCLQAVLSIQDKSDFSLSDRHVMALYKPLRGSMRGTGGIGLSGHAARRVIRAYMANDEDDAADVILDLSKAVLNEPRPKVKTPKAPWIACEAIVYLASIDAFPQAVQLLQKMIADALLPVGAVHEMQLVDRSHPNASGIVVISAVIRACLEWQWLERTVRMVHALQVDYLDSCEVQVPARTVDLLEDVLRTLMVSKDYIEQAGKLIVDLSKSPNFPPLSPSLIDNFYDRTPGVFTAANVYEQLEKSPVAQHPPSSAALAGLCRYFATVTRSKRSVASLVKHIRKADSSEMMPFRGDFLIHLADVGLRDQAAELYRLWSHDERDVTFANSEIMLALVRSFTSSNKSQKPFEPELAQTVIQNYLRAVPAVSIANIAHTSALRLARAFFLVKSDSSALKLFDHILLDRRTGINTADVGALIVSISEDRPLAAVELLKRAHRWGVTLDRGTYDATIKRATQTGEVDLARSIQEMALEQGVEPLSPSLAEAEWLQLIDESRVQDLVRIARHLRRTRDNPHHQVSEQATGVMVRKAIDAREWRVAVEVWRTRLRPRSRETLAPREDTVALITPLVDALELVVKQADGKNAAAEISAIRSTLYDQEPSKTRDQLVRRCLAMLADLGIKSK